MKPASPELVALLATREFVTADLYTIDYVGGGWDYFTTADTDVLWGGNLYAARRVMIEGDSAQVHWKTGLDVDTWRFTAKPRAKDAITGEAFPDKIGPQPWLAAACSGALDGATVQIDRAYWPAWPQPYASPLVPVAVLDALFVGTVADVDLFRDSAGITLNSALELLTQEMPREVFQAACRHTLFDSGCTLDGAANRFGGVAVAGSTQAVILSALGAPSGSKTFALGRVAFTSGANAGFTRSVRRWSGGQFVLMSPFPFPVSAGDEFDAYLGCDKTMTTCALFANSLNFGGQPFIPAAETAV